MATPNENQIVFVDENGKERLMEILFAFECEEYGKNYVFFYPASKKGEENIEVLCASYVSKEGEEFGELFPIDDDNEWDMLSEVLELYSAGELE